VTEGPFNSCAPAPGARAGGRSREGARFGQTLALISSDPIVMRRRSVGPAMHDKMASLCRDSILM